jgi:hypothetical protein
MKRKMEMLQMKSLREEDAILLEKIEDTLEVIKQLSNKVMTGLDEGIQILRDIRKKEYENINQHQHSNLILKARKWLESKENYQNAEWYWHPRQTGGSDEPDLHAKRKGAIILSAEITTSEKPQGTIKERMNNTLRHLNGMEGERFYFIRTDSMKKSAEKVVNDSSYKITVIML